MKPVRRILVAIADTSARTQLALEKAALLAQALGASVELFHAISEPVYVDSTQGPDKFADLWERQRDWHLGHLQLAASRLCERGVQASAYAAWDFPVYEAIIRRALEVKADLIVAQSHTRSRMTRWLLRLTDWELLRLSPVPVLLVRTRKLYERPIVLAAVDPMHAHAKPAALDDAILEYADTIARLFSGSVHAVHAHFPVQLDVPPSQIVSDPQSGIRHTCLEQKARKKFAAHARKARIPRARQHFVSGNPSVVIPERARTLGADLVVMGAVSRTGLRRLFIGNTAERVLHQLHTDVLIVKPGSFRRKIARLSRGARLVSTRIRPASLSVP